MVSTAQPEQQQQHDAAASTPSNSGRQLLSIAPMMDWTDVHYRQMARLISRRTWLWTEMVVDKTVLHTPHIDKFLWFPPEQRPIVFQLGGSDPETLGAAARKVAQYGYDEINLNCGCPSDRVAGAGCFGASLMLEPELVARCMAAIAEAAPGVAVTVKCRLGVDDVDSYEAMRRFVQVVSEGSPTRHFIIHARKCLLKGLSPQQNRTVPPLRYAWVYALKRDFPHLQFSLNGGIQGTYEARAYLDHTGPFALPPTDADPELADAQLQEQPLALLDSASGQPWQRAAVDDDGAHGEGDVAERRWIEGVMIGRQAYNDPWNVLGDVDRAVFDEPTNGALSRRQVLERYAEYADEVQRRWSALHEDGRVDPSVRTLVKPLLNLFHGEPGSKKWKSELDLLMRSEHASVADLLAKSLHLLPDAVLDAPPRQGPLAELAQRNVLSMVEPAPIPVLRFPRPEDRAGDKSRSDVVAVVDLTGAAPAQPPPQQEPSEGEQHEVSPDACCIRQASLAHSPADHLTSGSNGHAPHALANGQNGAGAPHSNGSGGDARRPVECVLSVGG